jgi:hypothetical protein
MPDVPGVPETTTPSAEQVTLARLEDQAGWYDRKSQSAQRRYKWMKGLTIVSAALIPVLTTTTIPYTTAVAGGLGLLIAILEGIQQMNRYQANWTSYRATAEALKREKFLYLGKASPYLGAPNPQAMLAARVEALVSQENTLWASVATDKQAPRNSPAPPAESR